jgi:uncharacterized protein
LKPTALVLFGKVPLPGRVKTRLAGAVGPKIAAALSESFLRDAARGSTALAMAGNVVPVLAGDPAPHPFWDELFPPPWRIETQGEGDLGRRLASAFEREFERFERVAVVGADHPALKRMELERFLESSNAIWPTRDGGYAALLLTRCAGADSLFDGVAWSTGRVFEQTLVRAQRASIALEIFPETYDVDREEDLEFLARDLQSRDPLDPDFPRETWATLRRFQPSRFEPRVAQ